MITGSGANTSGSSGLINFNGGAGGYAYGSSATNTGGAASVINFNGGTGGQGGDNSQNSVSTGGAGSVT